MHIYDSIRNKFDCLSAFTKNKVDTLMISETKLGSSFPQTQFFMSRFSEPYRVNTEAVTGGVLLKKVFLKILLISHEIFRNTCFDEHVQATASMDKNNKVDSILFNILEGIISKSITVLFNSSNLEYLLVEILLVDKKKKKKWLLVCCYNFDKGFYKDFHTVISKKIIHSLQDMKTF